MRKISTMIVALALVLGTSQCKKQENSVANGEKQHIVLNASFAGNGAKIAEDNTGGLKWQTGDVITVTQGGAVSGTLSCIDAENGIFDGEVDLTQDDLTFTFGTQPAYFTQSGSLEDAIFLTATAPFSPAGDYDVMMNMPYAVLKIDLSAVVEVLGETTTIAITENGSPIASVKDVTAEPKDMYVAVPAVAENTTQKSYRFDCDIITKGGGEWALAANTFYTSSNDHGKSIKVVPSEFTLNGKTVYFSKGLLLYDKTAGEFSFESSQVSNPASWGENIEGRFFWTDNVVNAVAEEFNDDWNTQTSFFADNAISGWRTLTGSKNSNPSEWYDLLLKPNNTTWVNLGGTLSLGSSGFVCFPDSYSGATSGLNYIPDGCVFIPMAGNRYNPTGTFGNYWSSTPSATAEKAYGPYFGYESGPYVYNSGSGFADGIARSTGRTVRLVKDKK